MSRSAVGRAAGKRRNSTAVVSKNAPAKALKKPTPGKATTTDAKAKVVKPSPRKTHEKSTSKSARSGDARPAVTRAVRATYKKLVLAHPDAHCELAHSSPFELVVATALSAQSTDVQVNRVTPGLFKKYPTPEKLARAEQAEVEECVNRLGMFRQKAKNLIGLAKRLVDEHGGEVPADQAKLVALPGVGRKTANVVLGVAFQAPVGVVVDTHVQRITQRLGWTKNTTPEKIERELMDLLPRSEWDRVSHTLIFHGRRICSARKPACSTCPVNKECASAFEAEEVGRKPKRIRARPD